MLDTAAGFCDHAGIAYQGGKAGAGVYQRIINQIPPHDVYVEPFLGDGAILRRKRLAARNVGIEIDPDVAVGLVAEFAASATALRIEYNDI